MNDNINYSTIKRTTIVLGVLALTIGVAILIKLYLMIAALVSFGIAIVMVIGFFIGHYMMFGGIDYLKVVTNDILLKRALVSYMKTGGKINIVNDDGTPLMEKEDDKQ